MSEPHSAAYAEELQADGAHADAAVAQARQVMASADDVFGDLCDCIFDAQGGWFAIEVKSAVVGMSKGAWLGEQLATPEMQTQLEPCMATATTNLEAAVARAEQRLRPSQVAPPTRSAPAP